MTQSMGRQFTQMAQKLYSRVDASGGSQPARPTRIERSADTCAMDWQIILHLRSLFESNPSLISALIDDVNSNTPAGYVQTLLVAAKEALAERPGSVDLHLHTATAAARCGRLAEAESLLSRLLALDPGHPAALAMLTNMHAAQPTKNENTNAEEASVNTVDEIAGAVLRRHGRRGNELPS